MARKFHLHLSNKLTNHFIARYFHGNLQGMAIIVLTDSNIEQIKSVKNLFAIASTLERSIQAMKSVLQNEKKIFPYPVNTNPKDIIDSKVFDKEHRTNKAIWKVEPFDWHDVQTTYIVEEIYLICEKDTFHFELHYYPERGITETKMLVERIPYDHIGL
jgi:hypothetical protein